MQAYRNPHSGPIVKVSCTGLFLLHNRTPRIPNRHVTLLRARHGEATCLAKPYREPGKCVPKVGNAYMSFKFAERNQWKMNYVQLCGSGSFEEKMKLSCEAHKRSLCYG